MNLATVERIAKAVLYEGYMLYPYRPSSVKNQRRWNFGVLCPQAYCEAQTGSDACIMQTECLVQGSSLTPLEVRVRFLQLIARSIGELTNPVRELRDGQAPEFDLVPRLEVDRHIHQPWQEAVEREVLLPVNDLETLTRTPLRQPFLFAAAKEIESLHDGAGMIVGIIIREQSSVLGTIELNCEAVDAGFYKVSVQIRNLTPFSITAHKAERQGALLSSLVSTHTILGVANGRCCSLLAPPDHLCEVAAGCQNIGTWPVLVGNEGDVDTMLSSPIILPDYPQIAPESAGDLFDGTEIDEILTLRIMTLTDEEKREMRQSDERARQMLERTEALPPEQLMKLHGVLRYLNSLKEEAS